MEVVNRVFLQQGTPQLFDAWEHKNQFNQSALFEKARYFSMTIWYPRDAASIVTDMVSSSMESPSVFQWLFGLSLILFSIKK